MGQSGRRILRITTGYVRVHDSTQSSRMSVMCSTTTSKVQHWRFHPMLVLLFILAKAGGEKAGGVQIHSATREFIVSSAWRVSAGSYLTWSMNSRFCEWSPLSLSRLSLFVVLSTHTLFFDPLFKNIIRLFYSLCQYEKITHRKSYHLWDISSSFRPSSLYFFLLIVQAGIHHPGAIEHLTITPGRSYRHRTRNFRHVWSRFST